MAKWNRSFKHKFIRIISGVYFIDKCMCIITVMCIGWIMIWGRTAKYRIVQSFLFLVYFTCTLLTCTHLAYGYNCSNAMDATQFTQYSKTASNWSTLFLTRPQSWMLLLSPPKKTNSMGRNWGHYLTRQSPYTPVIIERSYCSAALSIKHAVHICGSQFDWRSISGSTVITWTSQGARWIILLLQNSIFMWKDI